MFKKSLPIFMFLELAACIYFVAFCRPSKPVYVKVKPSDAICADYVARENMAWLESLAKLERIKKDAQVQK